MSGNIFYINLMRCATIKRILGFLLIIPCYSFANEAYPDKISCIVDKYAATFPKIKRLYKNYEEFLLKEIQIELVDAFFLEREKGTTLNGTVSNQRRFRSFWLEIWTLKTSTDANRLFERLPDYINPDILMKPPKLYFAYENFFILLESASTDSQHVIQEGACKIFQTCFEHDAVAVKGLSKENCQFLNFLN